jgi:hypothetical protein
LVTRVSPFAETLKFGPLSWSAGFAEAVHGAAKTPAPIPIATASPPTRPTYAAYDIIPPQRVKIIAGGKYLLVEGCERG